MPALNATEAVETLNHALRAEREYQRAASAAAALLEGRELVLEGAPVRLLGTVTRTGELRAECQGAEVRVRLYEARNALVQAAMREARQGAAE